MVNRSSWWLNKGTRSDQAPCSVLLWVGDRSGGLPLFVLVILRGIEIENKCQTTFWEPLQFAFSQHT